MKVRAGLLAVLALAVFAGAGHAQHGHYPHRGAAAGPSAQPQGDSRPPVGSEGTARSPEVESGPRSRAGSATGSSTENAAEHQPAIKPGPGDHVRENMSNSPIDVHITVHQGRASNRGPGGMGVAVRAIALRLQNKSRPATAPGVAIHQDAHNQPQKPTQMSFRAGVSFPPRNAVGAGIEPRTASQVSHSASQSLVPPGARTPPSGAPAAVSAAAGPVAATDHNRAVQQIIRPDVAAHGLVAMSAGGPAINGTAMIRPGAGTGAIGGPAKSVTSVISGANVRMRHP
jgi:hypothetical protein